MRRSPTIREQRLGLHLPQTKPKKTAGLLGELLVAIEDVKKRYASTPTADLRKNRRAAFEDTCDGIFDFLGPRLYPRDTKACAIRKAYSSEYPTDLYYDSVDDHDKYVNNMLRPFALTDLARFRLQGLFRDLLLEKCINYRANTRRTRQRGTHQSYSPDTSSTAHNEGIDNDSEMYTAPTATMTPNDKGDEHLQGRPESSMQQEEPFKRPRLSTNNDRSASGLSTSEASNTAAKAGGPWTSSARSPDPDSIHVNTPAQKSSSTLRLKNKRPAPEPLSDAEDITNGPPSSQTLQSTSIKGKSTSSHEEPFFGPGPSNSRSATQSCPKIWTIVDWKHPNMRSMVLSTQTKKDLKRKLIHNIPQELKGRTLRTEVKTAQINPWDFITKHGLAMELNEDEMSEDDVFDFCLRAKNGPSGYEPCLQIVVEFD